MYDYFIVNAIRNFVLGLVGVTVVTIHGVLHPAAGHPANNLTVSGIQPLAEGDLEWAGCVTVCGRLGREL